MFKDPNIEKGISISSGIIPVNWKPSILKSIVLFHYNYPVKLSIINIYSNNQAVKQKDHGLILSYYPSTVDEKLLIKKAFDKIFIYHIIIYYIFDSFRDSTHDI